MLVRGHGFDAYEDSLLPLSSNSPFIARRPLFSRKAIVDTSRLFAFSHGNKSRAGLRISPTLSHIEFGNESGAYRLGSWLAAAQNSASTFDLVALLWHQSPVTSFSHSRQTAKALVCAHLLEIDPARQSRTFSTADVIRTLPPIHP